MAGDPRGDSPVPPSQWTERGRAVIAWLQRWLDVEHLLAQGLHEADGG